MLSIKNVFIDFFWFYIKLVNEFFWFVFFNVFIFLCGGLKIGGLRK